MNEIPTLNPSHRPFYELKLDNLLLQARGTAFQTFFEQVLELRFGDDFVKVRPAGRDGDGGCDGMIRSSRQFFQVYAPNDLVASTSEAILKIEHDFKRAVDEWGDHFDFWIFAHNDRRGLPPKVHQYLLEKNGTHGKDCLSWTPGILRRLVFDLKPEDIEFLLGPPFPLRALLDFGPEHVQKIVAQLARTDPDPLESPTQVPPGKLEFNELSSWVADLIHLGLRRVSKVRHHFERHADPTLRDQIARSFNQRYKELRSAGLSPDSIFSELRAFASIPDSNPSPAVEGATLTVLAFFFESCDVFERPPWEVVAQ